MMKHIRNKIKRYVKRMSGSLAYISSHPLTRKRLNSAYLRYFGIHIIQFITRKIHIKYHFIDGTYFYASLGDSGVVGNIYTGLADLEEMSFLLHFLKSNDIFVDVGANVGAYSLLASGVCKSKTIAIEPIPATFKKLIANIKLNNLNNFVECMNVGLGSKEEILNFIETPQSEWNHVSVNNESTNNSQVAVKVIPLDSIIRVDRIPAMLKIDVEGFEMEVLNGAHNCLTDNTCKVVIIELNGSGEKYGYSDEQVYSTLISYGFIPYQYEPFTRNLKKLDGRYDNSRNIIFIRDIDSVLSKIEIAPKRKILSQWI